MKHKCNFSNLANNMQYMIECAEELKLKNREHRPKNPTKTIRSCFTYIDDYNKVLVVFQLGGVIINQLTTRAQYLIKYNEKASLDKFRKLLSILLEF